MIQPVWDNTLQVFLGGIFQAPGKTTTSMQSRDLPNNLFVGESGYDLAFNHDLHARLRTAGLSIWMPCAMVAVCFVGKTAQAQRRTMGTLW